MTISNENLSFQQLNTEIITLFRGYGQDLAMKGAERNTQRWGTPELYIAILAVLIWVVKTVSKATIDNWIRIRLSKHQDGQNETKYKDENSLYDDKINELESRVSILEQKALKEGIDLKDRMKYLEETWKLSIDILTQKETEKPVAKPQSFDELYLILKEFGLTDRHAHQFVARTQDFLLIILSNPTELKDKE